MNIMMLLEMASSGCPDRVAFVDPEVGASVSYQELFDAAGKMAAVLRDTRAERFAMLDVSNIGIPIGLFASGWAGIPYVPLNYRLTDPELESLLERITPAYLVTEPERVAGFDGREGVEVSSRSDFVELAREPGEPTDAWSICLLYTSPSPRDQRG